MKNDAQAQEIAKRDALGTISRICDDMKRSCFDMDENGLKIHYKFLNEAMRRLYVIQSVNKTRRRF